MDTDIYNLLYSFTLTLLKLKFILMLFLKVLKFKVILKFTKEYALLLGEQLLNYITI